MDNKNDNTGEDHVVETNSEDEHVERSSNSGLEPEGSRGSNRALDALIEAAKSVDEEDCYANDASSPGNYYHRGDALQNPASSARDEANSDDSHDSSAVIAGDRTSGENMPHKTQNGSGSENHETSGQARGDNQGQEGAFHSDKGQSTREDEEKKDYTPSEEADEKPIVAEPDLQLEDIIKAVNRGSAASAEADESKEGNNVGLMNDIHSSPSPSEEKPKDASGICSLGRDDISDRGAEGSLSPIHEPIDPPVRKKEKVPSNIDDSGQAGVIQTPLETPLRTPDKQASKVAISSANKPPQDAHNSPGASSNLSDELLRNKEKEGFALLARGETNYIDNLHHGETKYIDILHQGQRERQQPQRSPEPEFVQRRAADNYTPLNGMASKHDHQEMMENTTQSDNSSYRPAFSYPSSPHQLPPQAVTFHQNGYQVVMPHHPAQAPHAFLPQPQHHVLQHQGSFGAQPQMIGRSSYGYQTMAPAPGYPGMAPAPPPMASSAPGGKRKIRLKLQEEILSNPSHARRASFFQFPRRSSRKMGLERSMQTPGAEQMNEVDRGAITISWFEGTSTLDLVEHVSKSISRKLDLGDDKEIAEMRFLDTTSDPPEEIVLCPYIPSGSEFVLRYKITKKSGHQSSEDKWDAWNGGPPDSPSAAPSPFPSHGNLGSLNQTQLTNLRKQLDDVQGEPRTESKHSGGLRRRHTTPNVPKSVKNDRDVREKPIEDTILETSQEINNVQETEGSEYESETETLQPGNSVDAKLRQITELLLMDRQKEQHRYPRVKKRQVLTALANYFVFFIAFITISAEIQARAPSWLSWMENELENVQNCSADKDALFQCVSNGEFAGLFASVILWLSRSATTKRFFLFGFESPKKLWAVFYESLVGAICWGCSYMFIRRGMNPDTRPNFLQKYWKDALYGSLAGFNATFMKQVLKNLIPQEAVEEAFNERQLKILSWLPSFA